MWAEITAVWDPWLWLAVAGAVSLLAGAALRAAAALWAWPRARSG